MKNNGPDGAKDNSADPPRSSESLIRLVGLHKIYHMGLTDVHALAGVDLEIRPGEFVSITGPSGSGKSTVMGIIGCLDRPTRGRYYFRNELVSAMGDRQLARIRNQHIGFVFQTFNLLPRISAVENVALPLFYARKLRTNVAALEALEQVGLADRATHAPTELSGGERQRVAIARAVVNHPDLLLADEPTGNLDTRTGAQIMTVFRDLHRQGVTVVVVSHEHGIAIQAERMVQMVDGKIIDDRAVDPHARQQAIDESRRLAEKAAFQSASG